MNPTRIKITTDCDSVSYQAQYGVIWLWGLFTSWHDSYIDFETLACFNAIEQAQEHIDNWIIRQAEIAKSDKLKAEKRRTKKISYMKYP